MGRDHAEDLGVENESVGAQVDVPVALDDAVDELFELRVDRRLAGKDPEPVRPEFLGPDRPALVRRPPRRRSWR